MEDRKFIVKNKKFILSFIIFNTVFLFSYIFAYSPYYTHPDLTEEIAKLWNFKNSNQDLKISQNEIQWMRQGAIDEDKPARWINHFYDPVHETGWSGKHFGYLTSEEGLYQGESISPRPAIASIDWVTNQEYQSAYGRQFGNQTWQKALKSYIDGDKKSAFIAVGHILHLIEDASVPDHTRDDTHADLYGDPGSPYEKYSKEYTNFNKLNIVENLKDKELLSFSTIQDAFNYLANYSNNNFFSEDTISNEDFQSPNIEKLEIKAENIGNKKLLFLHNQQKQIYLAVLKEDDKYSVDNEFFVLPSYFSNLSSQAVLTGVSVMNLFFREVEKYKQNPQLLPEIIPDSNEAIISYLRKSPRLVIVNAADLKDKIETNASIYASKAKTGIQNLVSNFNELFSKSENTTTANIGSSTGVATNLGDQVANQTESRITNQESGILNQSVEVEPPNSKEEVQPQNVGPIPSVAEEIQPYQSEIIHAPYQRQETETTTEIIHAPWPGKPYGGDKVGIDQDAPIIPMFTGGGGSANNPNQSANNPSANSRQDSSTDSTNLTQDNSTPSTDQGETPATNTDQSSNTDQPIITKDLTPPPAPIITTNSSADYIIKKFTSQYPERKISLVLEGTKSQDTSKILINDSANSVNYPTETSWKKDFILSEGDNVFEARAKDSTGNISELTTIKITLQFSDVGFYLTNYNVRQANFTLNWQDDLSVANSWELQYKLGPNFDWADLADSSSLITNSYSFIAKYDDLTYYFRLRGSDANGNQTDWQYLQADISSKPVVINEIAWAGTQASTNDEWIELANKTDQEIDLTGWVLKVGTSSNTLSGKIGSKGFYLLKRTDDKPISNLTADGIYRGALNDDSGSAELVDENNKIIDTVIVNAGTTKEPRKTLERSSIWGVGKSQNSGWYNGLVLYQGEGGEALDSGGNKILGTPRAKNSVAGIYSLLIPDIKNDTIFLKEHGPYMVYNTMIDIPLGVNLIIEPGTVFKFSGRGGFTIKGNIKAEGISTDKTVFTSFNDDEYGGDSNRYNYNYQPKKADWEGLLFEPGSRGILENVLLRYGGNVWMNGMVYVNNADVKISGTTFENAYTDALQVSNTSNFDFYGNEFKNNGNHGISISKSSGKIEGNIFDNNSISGIDILTTEKIIINSNKFINNQFAIRSNRFGNFEVSGNEVSGNDYNGIIMRAAAVYADEHAVLSSDMPFVINGGPIIQEGGILEIMPGVIIKFASNDQQGLKIYGTLKAIGTSEKPIIFTSIFDDSFGGDTNNDGNNSSPKPGNWAVIDFFKGENHIMESVIIKYGSYAAFVEKDVKNFVFSNSEVSHTQYGLTVSSEGVIVENSIFSNNGIGLIINANNIIVRDTAFASNQESLRVITPFRDTLTLENISF